MMVREIRGAKINPESSFKNQGAQNTCGQKLRDQIRYLRDSVYISCHWKLCHYADCYWDLRTKRRHFSISTFISSKAFNPETSCNNPSSSNKPKSYLLMIMCCCGHEFQLLGVPTHSRPPSRSTFPTFCVPNTPSPLGYKVSNMSLL